MKMRFTVWNDYSELVIGDGEGVTGWEGTIYSESGSDFKRIYQ